MDMMNNKSSAKNEFGVMTLDTGYTMTTYKNIPLLPCSAMGGKRAGQMASPTILNQTNTGGFLADGTYYVQVVKYTLKGESLPSAVIPVPLSGGTGTQKFDVNFAPDPKAIRYAVYFGTDSLNLTRHDEFSGVIYTAAGTYSADRDSFTIDNLAKASWMSEAMKLDKPNKAVNGAAGESIILQCLDPIQGLGELFFKHSKGNAVDGLVSMEKMGKRDDYSEWLIKSYVTTVPSNELTSAMRRGLRAD